MISDRHLDPLDDCEACEEYHVYRNGLCWRCENEYRKHELDFMKSDFADTAEDIGYGKVQQDRIEKDWK